jgi:bifunctional UDP-N-acetylglucosamine pyrophosphorylase/glucosamine-1-phosphate N-acetyltransferase
MQQERAAAVVLAAGIGKRFKSDLPKVVHDVAGRSLVAHVLAVLAELDLDRTVVVSSADTQGMEKAIGGVAAPGLSIVVQEDPRGTGDAVKKALDGMGSSSGPLLVVPGDTPLLLPATLKRLVVLHANSSAAATVLTARLASPSGYGRIVRSSGDEIDRIVEDRDASVDEQSIDEINSGVYVFDPAKLAEMIDKVDRENSQGEYYLTDVIALLRSRGDTVLGMEADPEEIAGVNDRIQLASAAAVIRRRVAERWMAEGVTIVDPSVTYIDASVTLGRDVVVHPFTFLQGATSVGSRSEIGPQTRVVDSEIGEDATVSFAVVRGSKIGDEASVGPFASLRPGTKMERGSRLGTFVESKETTIGENSKANHLSYLGDAEIGSGVNVGAGTITCNWDGTAKHKTTIEDDAYIASDTMLVAPVHIGKRAATGAGSVVRDDVPDDALAVGVPARVIPNKGNKMAKKPGTEGDKPRQ